MRIQFNRYPLKRRSQDDLTTGRVSAREFLKKARYNIFPTNVEEGWRGGAILQSAPTLFETPTREPASGELLASSINSIDLRALLLLLLVLRV